MPILAIDQGTTSTRAMILRPHRDIKANEQGEIIHSIGHQQHYPQAGWVEHDPEELIRNIRACIDRSTALFSAESIQAIGIDNQGESCLAWDAQSKQAVSPVIVWQDNRSQKTIDALKDKDLEAFVLQRSGLPLDTYFSASKLAWILEHIADARSLLRKGRLRLGTTDAFFLDRLTGKFVTDITTASRTSLMNLQTGQWDAQLCDIFNVPISALPDIVPTTGDFGSIESNGIHIPVTASVVDQQASLHGHGCRNPGDAKITFGTGAFALSLTGNQIFRAPERGLLPTVAWQLDKQTPSYALDGGVYCAGSAINWAKKLGLFDSFEQINHFDAAPAIERHLAFVPALSGPACPHWDRSAAGLWIGLSLDTTALDMVQALLEGIAFRATEVIQAMDQFFPLSGDLSIDGGLTVNPYFCQFLSNALNRSLIVQNQRELTAMGTAQLAAQHACFDSPAPQQPIAEGIGKTAGTHSTPINYSPQKNMDDHIAMFREAIARSKNWK